MPKYTIGVDVGGTNIKLGLVDPEGKIISRSHLPTATFTRSKKALVNALNQAILDLIRENHLTKSDIAGIGIGLPGLINPKAGVVNFLPNIPGWKNVPLQAILQNRLNIRTFIENDVNMITLGEWKYGAGKGTQNLVCITLGTGIGGGLILDNKLYRGEGFVAGEIGHAPLNEKGPKCNCGGYGCFEKYVGNKTLVAKLAKVFKSKSMRLEDSNALARKGNKKALKFWQETGTHVANGLVGIINVLNPRLIIIGGGVANNLPLMLPTINSVIQKRCMNVQKKMVRIIRARLIDDAGILGAQVLVNENSQAR